MQAFYPFLTIFGNSQTIICRFRAQNAVAVGANNNTFHQRGFHQMIQDFSKLSQHFSPQLSQVFSQDESTLEI